MGYYTPRTRFCEVQFYDWLWQPDYRGVYVMMEKIKRDGNRVNIAKLDSTDNNGDQLTGGYIIAVDKNIWAQDSGWTSSKDTGVFFSYKYPKQDDITPQQKYYIREYVDTFETVLQGPNFADPATGFRKYAEQYSFMDFFFMQEFTKNIDAFRRSAYMYKDKDSKGGKLVAGPLWDFNSSLYNVKLCTFEQDTGWAYQTVCWLTSSYHIPFWWDRFLQDTVYANDLKCRWMQRRATVLDTGHIYHLIDSMAAYISQGAARHFLKYDTLSSMQPAVDSLKWWISKRLDWLDANMPGNCYSFSVNEANASVNALRVYPNPSTGLITIRRDLGFDASITVEVFDVYGRRVKSLMTEPSGGKKEVTIDLGGYTSGVYFLRASAPALNWSEKIILTR